MNVQYLHVQGIMYELKLRTSRNQGQPERREASQVDNFTSALWTPKVLVVWDHTFASVRSWAAHTCCVSMIHFVGDIIEKSFFFFVSKPAINKPIANQICLTEHFVSTP